jgi:hypothetical protein
MMTKKMKLRDLGKSDYQQNNDRTQKVRAGTKIDKTEGRRALKPRHFP